MRRALQGLLLPEAHCAHGGPGAAARDGVWLRDEGPAGQSGQAGTRAEPGPGPGLPQRPGLCAVNPTPYYRGPVCPFVLSLTQH